MFRSTFIKKISISWLSQHNSNNFTSSKFLFIYIFANSSSLPTFQRSLKIFQHFQNIFIKTVNSLRNLQTEKFPISLPATVSIVSFHFNFLYFFSPFLSFLLISKIHSIPWYIRPFTRRDVHHPLPSSRHLSPESRKNDSGIVGRQIPKPDR